MNMAKDWVHDSAKQIRQHQSDIVVAVIIMVLGGAALYYQMLQINPQIITDRNLQDVWFESDLPRVFANLTDRSSDNSRLSVHPLFSLLTYPLTRGLGVVLRADLLTATRLLMALTSAVCLGTLFSLLRLIGCRRLDAALLTVLPLVSAAARFFLVVPETYGFGLLTILGAMVMAALAPTQTIASLWYVAMSALTMTITITNWMAGILATAVNFGWQQTRRITTDAFCVVVLLWGVQKMLFPSAAFFLGSREESKQILRAGSGGIWGTSQSFIFHTMVMPAIRVTDSGYSDTPALMHTQASWLGSGSIWGVGAVIVWAALLGLGLWALFTLKQQPRFRLFLGAPIAGQYLLHVVYGKETFLYSLHFLPLLITLVALSFLTRLRPIALILVSVLIISAGINNSLQYQKAMAFLQRDNFAEIVFQRPCTIVQSGQPLPSSTDPNRYIPKPDRLAQKNETPKPISSCAIDFLITSSR
jgi:hypothetical protein